eukprot:scaffold306564_cov28-Tisochrysis_lutea.AAC.4
MLTSQSAMGRACTCFIVLGDEARVTRRGEPSAPNCRRKRSSGVAPQALPRAERSAQAHLIQCKMPSPESNPPDL